MRRTLTISAHFFNSWNACRMKIPMVKKQTKGLGDTTEVLPLINSAGPITKRPRSEKKKTWALPYTTCAVTESTRTVRNTEGTRQTLKSKQQGTRSPGGIKICVKRELLLPCKPAEQDICIKPKVSLCAKCWFSLQKPRIYTHFHSTSCFATSLKKIARPRKMQNFLAIVLISSVTKEMQINYSYVTGDKAAHTRDHWMAAPTRVILMQACTKSTPI